jgi:hypothetical protein
MGERPKVYCFIGRLKSGGKGVRGIPTRHVGGGVVGEARGLESAGA